MNKNIQMMKMMTLNTLKLKKSQQIKLEKEELKV